MGTFAATAFISSCKGKKEKSDSEGLRSYTVSSIQVDSTWGYRIYQDTVPVIEQKNIPGLPGNNGFKTEKEAIITGELVKHKLETGAFPPSITKEELDSLGITYPH